MIRLETKTYNMILTEKQQKSSKKNQQIWISYKWRNITSRPKKNDKFIYSPLGKAFEKQIKTIKDQGENI